MFSVLVKEQVSKFYTAERKSCTTYDHFLFYLKANVTFINNIKPNVFVLL